MVDIKKFLDQAGVEYLWKKLSLEDYPNNQVLVSVITAIDETKADKDQLNNYYTKTEIDQSLNLISTSDIDTIWGGSINTTGE